jgi:hypothetical protein
MTPKTAPTTAMRNVISSRVAAFICHEAGIVDDMLPDHLPSGNQKRILARSCEAGEDAFNPATKRNRRTADRSTRQKVNLILNLILTLINWVEGSFVFTYVESTSEICEKGPFLFNSRPLYH